MKKIFMLAGEASGDLHGSYLIKELLGQDQHVLIKAWGGNKMKSAGAEIIRSLDHLAFMGFAEVAKNFSKVLTNFRLCKKHITDFKPDVIVFIDYPGFNLRMAKWAKSKGYKTIQYIAPAAWAWKENRVKTLHRYVDELLVILPFEKEFFAKHGIDAHYVGHPLIKEIEGWKADPNFSLPDFDKSETHIGLFPGSRLQEIKMILPTIMSYVKEKNDFQFYLAQPEHLDQKIYQPHISGIGNVHLIKGKNYDLLSKVNACIVVSGTATLEVALFDVPQVVVYKTSTISYAIAKRLVKTKFISLVNLICNKEIVTELIQDRCDLQNLNYEVEKLLISPRKAEIQDGYNLLKARLGEGIDSKPARFI